MIIVIDFDGTISRGKFPLIEGLQPYARETINNLFDRGYYIIINTCRNGDLLLEAINWMLDQGIKFHRVNDNDPTNTVKYNSNSRKIYGHVYVDDKQVGGLPQWTDTFDYIIALDLKWKEAAAVNSCNSSKSVEFV
jgi:hypothetical protein